MKRYDREYYRRWYGNPRTRIASAVDVDRKVRLAVAAAGFLLGRRITSVLDVGCGEGRWYAPLRRLRPSVGYTGVDSSDYVVSRYGKRRNIRKGTFASLKNLRLPQADLVICADVIQYVDDPSLVAGLGEIRRLTRGVAFIEAFSAEDRMTGDRDGWIERSEKELQRRFRDAGLTRCGFYCWIHERKIRNANRFEVCSA
jgi:SAM-dependent methyltransferase